MVAQNRRVVITGLGLISPIGIGLDPTAASLRSGRGGLGKLQTFDVNGLPCDAAGEVRDFNPKSLAIKEHKKTFQKNLKYMARDIQLAVAASEMAVVDGALPGSSIDPTRIGIDLGAGMISTELNELAPAINLATHPDGTFDYETYGAKGIPEIEPIWMLKYLPNMLACHISILNDVQGPSNTITQGEAASNAAIGEAFRLIRRGTVDMMVTGGADSKIHPLSLIRMRLNQIDCRWEGEPERACRPFDRQRKGTVPGEGAGILIIEELEHARNRGVKIYGEVLGFGSGSDANPKGGLGPDGRGVEIATRGALRNANLTPEQIGHINAHGLGTFPSDLAEARAYRRVFGDKTPPIFGLKGYTGNTASGCGAVELITSLIALRDQKIPITLNCDDPDPECGLDVVTGEPRPVDFNEFLSVNFTRHGQAAALIIRAGEPVD